MRYVKVVGWMRYVRVVEWMRYVGVLIDALIRGSFIRMS